MIILGIDPGTAETGAGIIKTSSKKAELIFLDCFRTKPDSSPEKRLDLIYRYFLKIMKDYQPQVVVLEGLFFNTNAKSASAVGRAMGVIMLAAARCRLPVLEYSPLKIKSMVDGYGRAKKKKIQERVKKILGLKEVPRPVHAADALAVAICHWQNLGKK
jgi:crossover junction endodeoxyribonuclease RuvC